ncbi:MAG: flagellar export chaperone FliS [bacterium]|jgi:flagellar protein FliS|nr:flagellar export chaperone FliS [bacterium]
MSQDLRFRQYHETQARTADRGRLLLMVYDAAVGAVRDSQRLMREGDVPGKGVQMDRAIRAVGELRQSLDMEKGQDIARSLDRLYEFMLHRMREANLRNDPSHLEVVARLLEDLRATWSQVIRRQEQDPPAEQGRAAIQV